MIIKVPGPVTEFYTDILAHAFESGGQRLAAGTTTGKVIVLERDWENNEAFAKMETVLPNSSAVLGLHWGRPGIFVSGKSLLYLYRPNTSGVFEDNKSLISKFDCMYDVQDVTCVPSGGVVFGACDDCKVRAWDVETQKLKLEFTDHKMPVEVCRSNEEYLVSGGQDGNVVVYDALLRSPKPIVSFGQGKSTITGLDISENSTWVAAGSTSSPTIYNLKNSATLPRISVNSRQKIYAVHFDQTNTLWWGGGAGRIFKSQDLTSISTEMKATYGEATIYHVYSITTASPRRLSVAGSSTGILFSDNSDFWEGMVHIS